MDSPAFSMLCLDWDSTISALEGVDELARRTGCGEVIAKLTERAMNGELPLEEVYAQRMAAIRPSRRDLAWLAERYHETLLPAVAAALTRLRHAGVTLHIVSGGLLPAILPVASALGFPATHVHAVDVYFDTQGNYHDYQRDTPLARSGGKAEVCRQLAQPGCRMAMVGDGQTDSETRASGTYFIGFGGVVARDKVRAQADYFANNWDEVVQRVLAASPASRVETF